MGWESCRERDNAKGIRLMLWVCELSWEQESSEDCRIGVGGRLSLGGA